MNFGNQQLIKKMNNLMLEYADDIVAVDNTDIIDFFQKKNILYRKDYIDFLAKFGGNQSVLFGDFNCTFQEITEIYLEEPDSELPPNNFCIFSNHTFADFYYIEINSGKICQDDYDLKKCEFKSINDFLWLRLFFTYHTLFSKNTIEKLSNQELKRFFDDESKYKLIDCKGNGNSLCGFDEAYLFKDYSIYVYFQNSGQIITYELNNSFVKSLKELF